jgi:bacterioferritin-associated ferredoxin
MPKAPHFSTLFTEAPWNFDSQPDGYGDDFYIINMAIMWMICTLLTIIRIRVHNLSMIVCVCKAISDRHIKAAAKAGATSVRELARGLGVGTCCGKCLPEAQATLSACLSNSKPSALLVPA